MIVKTKKYQAVTAGPATFHGTLDGAIAAIAGKAGSVWRLTAAGEWEPYLATFDVRAA